MLSVFPFSPEYADEVIGVILPIQTIEFAVPISLDKQPDLKDIPGFYQQGNGNFWVALSDDKVVGSIALLDIGNRQAALRKMFVAATHRGPALGVAKALLAALVTWCQKKNVREVYLGTTSKFLAAHRFYEKNGFREIEKKSLPGKFPIMAVDTKFYAFAVPVIADSGMGGGIRRAK
jgi:GNAT superfamily N-acetyltransferase